MTKYIYGNGFHFTGKFIELIQQLAIIENKHITLIEYIQANKKKLN
jgi:hypothetical protein